MKFQSFFLILAFACLFLYGGAECLAQTAGDWVEESAERVERVEPEGAKAWTAEADAITRVKLAITEGETVRFQAQMLEDPPAIWVEFLTRNVLSRLEQDIEVNQGILRRIHSEYYRARRGEPRMLQSLTLYLTEATEYAIQQRGNAIFIDIQTPPGLVADEIGPEPIEISAGFPIEDETAVRQLTMSAALIGAEVAQELKDQVGEELVEGRMSEGGWRQRIEAEVASRMMAQKKAISPEAVQEVIPSRAGQPQVPWARQRDVGRVPQPLARRGWLWTVAIGLLAIAGGWVWIWWRRKIGKGIVPSLVRLRRAAPIAQAGQKATVFEQLVLRSLEQKGYQTIGSKTIEGRGTFWRVSRSEGDGLKLLWCHRTPELVELSVIEQLREVMGQEEIHQGILVTLGPFTLPAQNLAKEHGMTLIGRDKLLDLISATFGEENLTQELEELKQQFAEKEGEIHRLIEQEQKAREECQNLTSKMEEIMQELGVEASIRERLEAELSDKESLAKRLTAEQGALQNQLKTIQQSYSEGQIQLGEEKARREGLEQELAQVKQGLEEALSAQKILQEELSKTVEASRELAEKEETLNTALKEKEQLAETLRQSSQTLVSEVVGEKKEAGKEKEEVVEAGRQEAWKDKERRKWPRLDLVSLGDEGILIRVESQDQKRVNTTAKNISAGGLCFEMEKGQALSSPLRLKLFFFGSPNPVEASGNIVWQKKNWRKAAVGIAFSTIAWGDQERIRQYVEETFTTLAEKVS